MSSLQVSTILEKFGGLDGGLLLSMGFDLGAEPRVPTRYWLEFQTYKNDIGAWKRLRIEAVGGVIFSWREIFWCTNIVLSYPVVVSEWQEKTVIDFDPLMATSRRGGVLLSDFYLGGRDVFVSEICDLPDPYTNRPAEHRPNES